MRGDSAIVLRNSPLDATGQIALVSVRIVCYDYKSRGEVSERLKELASKASVGGTLPWVQIPPSPPLPLFSCIYKPWCLSWCLLCTGFRPIIGGKGACRHVQTRQRLRQRNSRQYPQKSESRRKLEPLPRRRGA